MGKRYIDSSLDRYLDDRLGRKKYRDKSVFKMISQKFSEIFSKEQDDEVFIRKKPSKKPVFDEKCPDINDESRIHIIQKSDGLFITMKNKLSGAWSNMIQGLKGKERDDRSKDTDEFEGDNNIPKSKSVNDEDIVHELDGIKAVSYTHLTLPTN